MKSPFCLEGRLFEKEAAAEKERRSLMFESRQKSKNETPPLRRTNRKKRYNRA